MNIEESIMYLKIKINTSKKQIESGEIWLDSLVSEEKNSNEAIETLLTAYEKEKEKNKKAIDFINQRKKIVNKDMAEGTRLQVGTFMWQVDELLEILKGVEEE